MLLDIAEKIGSIRVLDMDLVVDSVHSDTRSRNAATLPGPTCAIDQEAIVVFSPIVLGCDPLAFVHSEVSDPVVGRLMYHPRR